MSIEHLVCTAEMLTAGPRAFICIQRSREPVGECEAKVLLRHRVKFVASATHRDAATIAVSVERDAIERPVSEFRIRISWPLLALKSD